MAITNGMRALAFGTLVLALAIVAAPALAQPMDTYGLGSRAVALGGAVTADVDDISANYYNPAGLVRGDQLRIGLGWFGVHHDLSLNGENSNVDGVHGLVTGLVVPGRIDDFRFAFGIGIHLNDERVSRTRSLPRTQPRWEFYDNRPQRTFLAAHIAVRPVDWLLIGGGIAFLSYSKNDLRARGDISYAAAARESRLEHNIFADLTTIRYPQFGVQVIPIPELSFGVVYRGQFALDSTLRAGLGSPGASSDVNILIGNGPDAMRIPGYLDLTTQSVNAFVPQQVSGGVAWNPIPELRVMAEVTWLDWSAYVGPIGRSDTILEITIPDSLPIDIFVPESIPSGRPVAAKFRDRVVPRLGIEGLVLDTDDFEVRVRGGGFYEVTPVPEQTGVSNLIDTDRLAVSAGAGLRLTNLRPLINGWLGFDVHLQYSYLPERMTRKASPIDPVGDWYASGQLFAGGITMEIAFE